MILFICIIFINLVFSNYSIIQSDSNIKYFGSHPMHSFSGHSSSVSLLSECTKKGDVCDLTFKVPMISLNSGNDNRDSNMLNYLNVFSYPDVILIVENFSIKEYDEEILSCEMIVAGMSQHINIPLSLLKILNNQYKVKSSFTILLDDFNVEIPKLLFLPIDNEIKIEVNLLIEGMSIK